MYRHIHVFFVCGGQKREIKRRNKLALLLCCSIRLRHFAVKYVGPLRRVFVHVQVVVVAHGWD